MEKSFLDKKRELPQKFFYRVLTLLLKVRKVIDDSVLLSSSSTSRASNKAA